MGDHHPGITEMQILLFLLPAFSSYGLDYSFRRMSVFFSDTFAMTFPFFPHIIIQQNPTSCPQTKTISSETKVIKNVSEFSN